MKDKKLKQELPGHADEVFALDWALDGSRVASGGKDKVVKMCVIYTIRILLIFYLNRSITIALIPFFNLFLFSAGRTKNIIVYVY